MTQTFNTTGMKAANERKREAARNAVITALRAAGEKGLTARDIVEAAGVSYHTVRFHMPELRLQNLAHIGPWELHGKQLVPSFIYGPGVDTKRDDYTHLLADAVVVDIEREARREAMRRHEKWQRSWTAHRDAAAAWI